jgi:hypothetical protein
LGSPSDDDDDEVLDREDCPQPQTARLSAAMRMISNVSLRAELLALRAADLLNLELRFE